mmetsp:Transcript_42440/g.127224  ORF Transcript_42440/g.127224 Transcript_42440/m.127224 type:complete len:204 (+) Transcript_42440:1054-1665(+)
MAGLLPTQWRRRFAMRASSLRTGGELAGAPLRRCATLNFGWESAVAAGPFRMLRCAAGRCSGVVPAWAAPAPAAHTSPASLWPRPRACRSARRYSCTAHGIEAQAPTFCNTCRRRWRRCVPRARPARPGRFCFPARACPYNTCRWRRKLFRAARLPLAAWRASLGHWTRVASRRGCTASAQMWCCLALAHSHLAHGPHLNDEH